MKTYRLALVLGALTFAAMFSGCTAADRYRLNETPELHTMALTREQESNRTWRVFSYGFRQMWDDVDMILLLDRPSKLSFYPIP